MIVKTVVSGDTLVIRGAEIGSRKVVSLHVITAPRKDEPWYFESRDALRKLLVGQSVVFKSIISHGREFGHLLFDGQDVSKIIVQNGWASVTTGSELVELEKIAKAQKIGIHSDDECIDQNLYKFLECNKEISGSFSFIKIGVVDILQDYFSHDKCRYRDLRGLEKVVDMIILELQLSFAQNIKDKVLTIQLFRYYSAQSYYSAHER